MKITNNKGLPQPLVAMAESDYILGEKEFRVTSLLKGLRETILERRHQDEIEVDVADRIFLLFGSAVHGFLEAQAEGANEFKEERLKMEIGGYILSGQFDLYNAETQTITDYKTASVWKIILGSHDDWRRQLLIYSYMLKQIGFPVKRGEIVALLKDHNKRDAKYKPDYPKLAVEKVTFDFTDKDFAEIEQWLTEKFEEVKRCESLSDDELPICTAEQRFNSGDKYAVMKKGRKTALRVLDSKEEAERWMAANGGDAIEVRKAENKKCDQYCNVNEFCSYWKGLNNENQDAQ